MRPSPVSTHRHALIASLLGALALVAIACAIAFPRARSVVRVCIASFAPPALAGTSDGAGMHMTDWFATHPTRGLNATAAAADSFTVNNFTFDSNGDGSATQVDTARIVQGQTVLWKWVSGSHTVTSGLNDNDPNAGLLFDQPVNSASSRFSYQFNTAGTFPFYCRFHWAAFSMLGVVIVSPPTAVPVGPVTGREGFVRPALPNPTHRASSFRFALGRPAHVRLDVVDVLGRRVATLLDSDLQAGTFDTAWDGLLAHGGPAPDGVYLARLAWPGGSQAQRLTLVR